MGKKTFNLGRFGIYLGLALLALVASLATKCNQGYQGPFQIFTFVDGCVQGRDLFLRPINLLNIMQQVAVNGILAVGMTVVILIGGIDLSVGSMLALTGVIAALLVAQLNFFVTVAIVLAMGALVGLWNGVLSTYLKLPSFIATLGMLNIARGGALVLSGAAAKFINNPFFTWVSRTDIPPQYSIGLTVAVSLAWAGSLARRAWRQRGRLAWVLSALVLLVGGLASLVFTGRDFLTFERSQGIPIIMFIFALVAVITSFVLRRTRFGRYVYAIGGNAEAARRTGIYVPRITRLVFVIGGVYASLAGLILAARLSAGIPAEGVAAELDAITAVVIGGTSFTGGVGTIGGTVVGAFIIGFISNSLTINGIDANWQLIVKGLIMIFAVALDQYGKRAT